MEFKLITDSAKQEMSLKFLNLVSNTNEGGEKWQIISRQIGKSAFNQSDPTTLKQIKSLLTNQMTFHLFNNTIPDCFCLNQTPNGRPEIFIDREDNLQPRIQAKPPPSFPAPTGTGSGLAKLILNSEAASKHKKSQRKPWLLEHLWAMNALLQTLEDFTNSFNPSPWVRASSVANSHAKLTLPMLVYCSRNTPAPFNNS